MAEKTPVQMNHQSYMLKPPFSPQPIPPNSNADADNTQSTVGITNQSGTISPSNTQPFLQSSTSQPLSALDSLPTITGKSDHIIRPEYEIPAFLAFDLDLARLNRIHGHLWMAGRPMRARPLHRYTMLGMQVIQTQQMDLHLLKFSSKLLIKPLPEWILCHKFWTDWICNYDDADGKREPGWLWKSAAGFLVSYVWLVTTPLDLKIAHENSLLPSFVTWHWWKAFVSDFISHVDIDTLHQVNKRYQFGDLRLGRINTTYRVRYAHTHFVRGYLWGYNRYVIFFQRKFSWVLIVFVFFSVVLSAMEVSFSLPSTSPISLENDQAFVQAAFAFVVFSMVSVLVILAFVVVIFVGTFVFNMVMAISHAGSEQRKRRELAVKRRQAVENGGES
ncbi:hypothetical protein COCSADRAFT_37666 [Bipolaris sorokiniana ND90Pr]|uniref:Uncharacterized protein n=1 Tax=Cochliobolus sativus (strain ND90Pr / ATCC 201652) TaxID=665912 RepID=M2S9C5_COCSN|nr:uncharacterized protein COCSADRAFT_37666 [Bipolaris sorokiniana ND90Pr]EMD63943.1 hypothetical protein COCSADRAFT_37666 [Bipolaris sorokiniana ND90Pr]